jgi:hypothetical protein
MAFEFLSHLFDKTGQKCHPCMQMNYNYGMQMRSKIWTLSNLMSL